MHADRAAVVDGVLVLYQKKEGSEEGINFALSPGQWEWCYAASMIDGGPVAVESWVSLKEQKSRKDRN